VTVHWTAPTAGSAVAFYDLCKDGQQCGTVPAGTTTGTCTGLSADFDAGIYVNARDEVGAVSDPSPTLHVHTPKGEGNPPTAPTGVQVTAGSLTSLSVGLSWTASIDDTGVVGYTVYDVTSGTPVKLGTPAAR